VFGTEQGMPIAGPSLVVTELRAQRLDKAAEAALSLIERDAKNPLYHTLLGLARTAQQDYSGAENAFRAALAIDPDFATATLDLAQIYTTMGLVNEARDLCNDLLAKRPDDVGALLGMANTYIAQQQWTEAIDAINHARLPAPNNPASGLKLVSLYKTRHDWNSAKSVATELAVQFPRDANILDIQGQVQLTAGDARGAVDSLKRAHELAPNSAPILSHNLVALNRAKYFTEARAVLQEAIARNPRNAALKADLIRIEAEINGVDAAMAEARAIAAADPGIGTYDLVLVELLEKAGRSKDAIAVLEKVIAATGSDERLIIALARLYNRSGDFLEAEAVLARRLQADPQSVAVGTAMAQQYLSTGHVQDAKKAFTELLARRSDDVAALLGLAEIATAEGNWGEATNYVNRGRTAAPNDPVPGIMLVNLELVLQDWNNALATAAQAAEQFPTNTDALDAEGRAQIAAGDRAGAIATYRRINELSPDSVSAMGKYVALLNAAKEFSEARNVLEGAIARDPKNSAVKRDLILVEAEIDGLSAGLVKARAFAVEDPGNSLYDIVSAELHEQAGRPGEAVELLEKAVADQPSSDTLVRALSNLYARTGDPDRAETVLNARLKDDPKDVSIRSALALLDLEQKKDDEAIAEFTRVVAESPADTNALNNLAWLYQQNGDLTRARTLAEQAVAVAPPSPGIDDTLGWILLAQGEADQALAYLSAANRSAPKDPDIQYHLAVALDRLGRTADAQAKLETLLGSAITFPDRAEAEKLLKQLKRR
jgi:tetratricopeptide (TPR) repeat protein